MHILKAKKIKGDTHDVCFQKGELLRSSQNDFSLDNQNRNPNKGIIMEDFNSSLTNEEKLGGVALDLERKLDLSNFINILDLERLIQLKDKLYAY